MKKKTITEKRELLKLYECKRTTEIKPIINQIKAERDKYTHDILEKMEDTQTKYETLQTEYNKILTKNKWDNLGVFTCGDSTHPKLLHFYAASAEWKRKLWSDELI